MVILAEGKFLRLIRDKKGWEYTERINVKGAAVIIAITEDRKIIVVEQYRPPIACNVIELPAGLAEITDNISEKLKETAVRELFEETGYIASEMKYLVEGPSSPGLSNETFTLFMANRLIKKGEGGGDDNEKIRVHEIPLNNIAKWLNEQSSKGIVVDPKVYLGLYFVNHI